MLLAVLEARCGLNFSSAEVYLNVAGGYRLTDPAADLAVAAALVSALSDKPLICDMWFSFRSPYSYLALEQIGAALAPYGVPLALRPIAPIVPMILRP